MIEVRVRALLMNDQGMSVVPSTTLVAAKAPSTFDVAKVADDLIAELAPSLGNLRPMTGEEADAYCEQERLDEESCGYTDLGLSDADTEESGW